MSYCSNKVKLLLNWMWIKIGGRNIYIKMCCCCCCLGREMFKIVVRPVACLRCVVWRDVTWYGNDMIWYDMVKSKKRVKKDDDDDNGVVMMPGRIACIWKFQHLLFLSFSYVTPPQLLRRSNNWKTMRFIERWCFPCLLLLS